jgi:predicted nucleic acid-binding protein
LRVVFVDTSFWVALLSPRDDYHDQAQAISGALGSARLVTSEMILAEWLNELARRGAALRQAAVSWVRRLQSDPSVEVVPQTSALFEGALALYAARKDKTWSLTDCASFSIMRARGIEEALAFDRHFEQGGFRAVLRP